MLEGDWKKWGTYLPLRGWGVAREDYSENGEFWSYLNYDDSRRKAYRWGEDGLLGWCDQLCRLCLAPVLWNGQDDHLKERLFGLSGPEGNHGEDVKEVYYYLDSLPTHAYARALYRYPQRVFPYKELREANQQRGFEDREFELWDTGIFDDGAFFDLEVEYAKSDPETTLVRYRITNQGHKSPKRRSCLSSGIATSGAGAERELTTDLDRESSRARTARRCCPLTQNWVS